MIRSFWPLLIPFSVALIGSWRLSAESTIPTGGQQQVFSRRDKQSFPNYTFPPSGNLTTCQQDPSLDEALLRQGKRLGVRVLAGQPELVSKDATYRAEHGRLGTITLKQRSMSAAVRCMLISHEFIHVLQHLHGNLKGVDSLEWQIAPEDIQRFGSIQEAEAYRYQNRAGHVIHLLRQTPIPQ
ncbi:hypothetical protein Syncc9902_0078 [Synechococcus sp. CC9902]|uniref:hypothetical protein n=1 Tax=Synechococcus sp. (strain CC9902) TaxID=316279 RepID=UPI00005D3CE7|nr:hypothetical protein [Synechococcus sp. CC9902]ABB25053.1 hypothetical protein Syncc9902_0078 [Synechococcus sp. CC9902]